MIAPNRPARRPHRLGWLLAIVIVVAAGGAALLGWLPTVQHGYQLRLVEGGAQIVLVTVAFGVICCAVALGTIVGRGITGGLFLLLVGLGFCGFGIYQGSNTWQDLVSGPATVRGPVTVRYASGYGRHGQVDRHLTVGGIAFRDVAGDLYNRAVMGSCVVVTYGPRTRIATGVTGCT